MTKRILTSAIAVLIACWHSSAQDWHISTNIGEWANLGTANIEAGLALDRHFSLHGGAAYNPWTFRSSSGRQFQNRRQQYEAGIRFWPWHVYSGWWVEATARYCEYNRGGILKAATEEGDSFGISLSGGYSLMLTGHLNLEFGLGAYTGMTVYTSYSCPRCGRVTGSGRKWFLLPDDLTIGLVWIF